MTEQTDSKILRQLQRGGEAALTDFFMSQRSNLRQFIQSRLNPRLAARIDGSDIVQEAFMLAQQRLTSYLANPRMPVIIRLKWICVDVLSGHCRRHIETQKRTIDRESISLSIQASDLVSDELIDYMPHPASDVANREYQERILSIIDMMKPEDRSILLLKHRKDVTLREAAMELEITYEAAKKRYLRALERLGVLVEKIN